MNLANAIRKQPLKYLPEISLSALHFFQSGYWLRCQFEDCSFDDDLNDLSREFDTWIRSRFGLGNSTAFNVYTIIASYSANDFEAFHDYFALRDEFLSSASKPVATRKPPVNAERVTLVQLLKKIRERPPLYLGDTSFRKCYLLLMGDERAYSDMGLAPGEDRKLFAEFKNWVQKEKNKAVRPRSWHAIISIYGSQGDCGHVKHGAFSLFYEWLDEFSSSIGRPELFQAPVNWWQRKRSPNFDFPLES
jgi:hypothetical protein